MKTAVKHVLASALILMGVSSAFGQEEMSKSMFEANAGFDILLGPSQLKDLWNSGGGSNLAYSRYLSESLAIQATASFNRFTINEEAVNEYLSGELPDSLADLVDILSITDGDVWTAAARVGALYDIQLSGSSFENTNEGKVFFYIKAGAGIAYNEIGDLELRLLGESATVEGVSKTAFTAEGGGGFRFHLTNRFGLTLESTFVANLLEDDTLTYVPIRVGVFYR